MSRSGGQAPRHLAGDAPRRPPAAHLRQGAGPDPAAIDESADIDPADLLDAPRVERHRLAFAVASTFAALPILVVDNLPASADEEDVAAEVVVEIDAVGPDAPVTIAPTTSSSTTAAPSTTAASTTAAPTTAAPTTVPTTAAPVTTAAPTTTAAPATTAPPTTARPATAPPATAAPAPTGNTETGQATWYRQPPRYAPGGCAHKTLPFGTVVTITAHRDGATATCTVSDRGPFGPGRIIDLDDDVYVQLAPLSTGVLDVTITW